MSKKRLTPLSIRPLSSLPLRSFVIRTSSGGADALRVALIDLSSAYSRKAAAFGLYGDAGPTRAEETLEYSAPEALFPALHGERAQAWPGRAWNGGNASDGADDDDDDVDGSPEPVDEAAHERDKVEHDANFDDSGHRRAAAARSPGGLDALESLAPPHFAYDSWSLGVIILELLLGSNQVCLSPGAPSVPVLVILIIIFTLSSPFLSLHWSFPSVSLTCSLSALWTGMGLVSRTPHATCRQLLVLRAVEVSTCLRLPLLPRPSQVFTVDDRTRALLTWRHRKDPPSVSIATQ